MLSVWGLYVGFQSTAGVLCAVDDLSPDIRQGEMPGLVEKFACGKTMTALSLRPPLSSRSAEACWFVRDVCRRGNSGWHPVADLHKARCLFSAEPKRVAA
jgi:ABC-type glutathione transport system ATPase component